MFRNNFFYKNIVEERRILTAHKEKRKSATSDVSRALFPGKGKITNQ